ncbi:MAG: TadG family pilus assembly protein [Solirubrobacteraceae bacterium]
MRVLKQLGPEARATAAPRLGRERRGDGARRDHAVAMLGMAALAIDVGSFYATQRHAQAAADAGALAASQDLPANTAGAATDGRKYVLKNYPDANVTVTTNYNSTPADVKVTVSITVPSFFGQIFQITHADVSASAVAGGNGSTQQAAIFAYADNGACGDPGIVIDKNNVKVTGGIESNGSVTLAKNNGSYGTAVYGTGSGCSCDCSRATFVVAPYPSAPTPYPLDYRKSPLTPTCTQTFSGNVTDPGAAGGTIPPGVYCDPTGTITLSAASGSGVTFVANAISYQSSGALSAPGSPGAYGLLLYQTGCDAAPGPGPLVISGNGATLDGTIFAPCATVDIQGNNSSTGFIEANNVHIEKNNFTLTGDGPVISGTGDALIG